MFQLSFENKILKKIVFSVNFCKLNNFTRVVKTQTNFNILEKYKHE